MNCYTSCTKIASAKELYMTESEIDVAEKCLNWILDIVFCKQLWGWYGDELLLRCLNKVSQVGSLHETPPPSTVEERSVVWRLQAIVQLCLRFPPPCLPPPKYPVSCSSKILHFLLFHAYLAVSSVLVVYCMALSFHVIASFNKVFSILYCIFGFHTGKYLLNVFFFFHSRYM